jgi:hypothetical protein
LTDQHQAELIEPSAAVPRSRALVAIESRRTIPGDKRPEAFFLTQLIACDQRLPAYRQARKAEPNTATLAYARLAGSSPARLNYMV